MKTRLIKDLGDMNPGELEPKAWNGSDPVLENDVIDSMPEKQCMKARIKVFEAIIDEVAEDTIDEKEAESNDPVTVSDVEEVVEPIVDKAVALAIVPNSVRRTVSSLIRDKVVSHKTRSSLLAKAAHMVAEAVTDTDYNAGADGIDTPIDNTVNIGGEIKDATSEEDEAPNDGTTPTTSSWKRAWDNARFEDDLGADAGVSDSDLGAPVGGPASDIPVEVDDGLDVETAADMRYLVKSAIHHRRATAKVSRRFTAQLTDKMMYQLRYALPAKFYDKYRR